MSAQREDELYALGARYKYLRVSDVTDALYAVGRANITLVDPAIRPLWFGMKFWGPAVTERLVPANRPTRPLGRESGGYHDYWFKEESLYGNSTITEHLRKGSVLVTSAGQSPECGRWGSHNSLMLMRREVAGIVTSGFCRDTFEVIRQRSPIACRERGRTIISGQVEFAGVQEPVDLGGALVRPGDIVGCDDDGVVVVPQELAEEVLPIAVARSLMDLTRRVPDYDRLGIPNDPDPDEVKAFYRDLLY